MINDLVNRELIRRDFKFASPVFIDEPEDQKASTAEEPDEEDEIYETQEDVSQTISLAKYLRQQVDEIEVAKSNEDEEEKRVLPEKDAWMGEYRKIKSKLKEACKPTIDPDHYLTHITRVKRYLERVKDIMLQAGTTTMNNFIFICDTAITAINSHEKRLNNYVSKELVMLYKLISLVRRVQQRMLAKNSLRRRTHKTARHRQDTNRRIRHPPRKIQRCFSIIHHISL